MTKHCFQTINKPSAQKFNSMLLSFFFLSITKYLNNPIASTGQKLNNLFKKLSIVEKSSYNTLATTTSISTVILWHNCKKLKNLKEFLLQMKNFEESADGPSFQTKYTDKPLTMEGNLNHLMQKMSNFSSASD